MGECACVCVSVFVRAPELNHKNVSKLEGVCVSCGCVHKL